MLRHLPDTRLVSQHFAQVVYGCRLLYLNLNLVKLAQLVVVLTLNLVGSFLPVFFFAVFWQVEPIGIKVDYARAFFAPLHWSGDNLLALQLLLLVLT